MTIAKIEASLDEKHEPSLKASGMGKDVLVLAAMTALEVIEQVDMPLEVFIDMLRFVQKKEGKEDE